MKYMKQFGVILAISLLGELLNHLIPMPVPASIYGLILMMAALCSGLLRVSDVKETAVFLIEIMPMMFIPAGVGLLESWGVLKPILVPVILILVVSTVLVMGISGLVTQGVMHIGKSHGKRKK